MKRFGLVAVAIAAFGVINVANAADMPAKAPVYIAPPVAATPWTGFYVNGGIGYGMWAADTTILNSTGTRAIACTTQVQGGKGWLGRIGAGYDYQFTQHIVAGVFGDFDIASLEGTIQDGLPFRAGQIKETSAWAAGVRAGWLANSKTLGYINGGYTGARFSDATILFSQTSLSAGLTTPATTLNGWFLGGGVETSVAPNLFWRTEYRYSYYNSKDLPEADSSGAHRQQHNVQAHRSDGHHRTGLQIQRGLASAGLRANSHGADQLDWRLHQRRLRLWFVGSG